MKIKKILAAVAASIMMLSAMAINASAAGSKAVDFEDGDFSFVSMKTDDGGDASKISVATLNGSKMLKVDVQDATLVPKIKFDLTKMVGGDKLSKIDVIQLDLILEAKDGTSAVGWAGGAFGTQGPDWGQSTFEVPAENGIYAADDGSTTGSLSTAYVVERKFLLDQKYLVDNADDAHMLLMRWGQTAGSEVQYNMYIDNIKFIDKDGNVMEVNVGGTSTDKPATDDKEPSSPSTGNAGVAGLVVVAALATAGIVISKRK